MSGTGSLLIAIPTYNERDNVGALLPALLARYPDANVVVIDDNSPDGTGDIVAALARGDRRIHLIRRDRKRGLGSAYRAAFAWALEREYARVVVMDADCSHDPAEIAPAAGGGRPRRRRRGLALRAGRPHRELAVVPPGAQRRRQCSRAAPGRAARSTTGPPDSSAIVATRLPRLDLERIRSEGYSFQVEILFHCHRAGWKIQEVPITFVDRRLGRTKMSRREVYQAMVTLLSIAWRRLAG